MTRNKRDIAKSAFHIFWLGKFISSYKKAIIIQIIIAMTDDVVITIKLSRHIDDACAGCFLKVQENDWF